MCGASRKMGNGLAIRLPTAVVNALDLKPGDQAEVSVEGKRELGISRDRGAEKALERIRRLRRRLPHGFKFDQLEEARRE